MSAEKHSAQILSGFLGPRVHRETVPNRGPEGVQYVSEHTCTHDYSVAAAVAELERVGAAEPLCILEHEHERYAREDGTETPKLGWCDPDKLEFFVNEETPRGWKLAATYKGAEG